ncbi:EAL and HDOD domain-containing protein [Cryptosporangium arvum]|uniref:Putative signal transduction protein containing EAL and modified HD-GYP domains n=1 Tax=Cryptosporangium arvum DSM 44712 TaxID=927661 RepID=A0A010Z0H9_9ACTN|nr:HDOD domain-containing protein [Cryptosporangium arvum]EXG80958.1 putative signal transduction protein containing EAL and modified HD-GYP domains [Cryptosporangium arvum DSM 44712]
MHPVPAPPQPVADSTETLYVARQPIVNRDGQLIAYELLFRDAPGATASTERAAAATSRVLVNAFAEFGLERLVGDRLGFVNLTAEFLAGDLPLPFAPDLAVLEVLETVEVDDRVVAGVADLARQGYAIALDDFVWGTSIDRLLDYATYIKFEVAGVDPTLLGERVAIARRRKRSIKLLAERLETDADYQLARDLGFELFQGYLLGRPETLTAEAISPSKARQLELLGLLTSPDVDLPKLSSVIAADPGLALRILRATNSASVGQRRRIASIQDAVVILGLERLRQWLAVMIVSDLSGAGEADLSIPMVRGRWIQNIATQAHLPADVGFTIGLLSGVAELLGVDARDLADRLPLTDEVQAALVEEQGEFGVVLNAIRAYESGARGMARVQNKLSLAVLAKSYLEAAAWQVSTSAAIG